MSREHHPNIDDLTAERLLRYGLKVDVAPTEFKAESLFDLFDTISRRCLGLTVTSNYSLEELGRGGLLHPAIVRRIDDLCVSVEV